MNDETLMVLASALGWEQNDYPHKAAKELWYNDKAEICEDNDVRKYVDKEAMLGYIRKQVKDAEKAVNKKK